MGGFYKILGCRCRGPKGLAPLKSHDACGLSWRASVPGFRRGQLPPTPRDRALLRKNDPLERSISKSAGAGFEERQSGDRQAHGRRGEIPPWRRRLRFRRDQPPWPGTRLPLSPVHAIFRLFWKKFYPTALFNKYGSRRCYLLTRRSLSLPQFCTFPISS